MPLTPARDDAVYSVDEVVAALHSELAERWPDTVAGVERVHRYVLLPPGKLARPLLVVWSALASGGSLERVLPAAVGLEAAHTGSLLHDDIIDGDSMRRSRAAAHLAFGVPEAITAGNALFFESFRALARTAERGVAARAVLEAMRVHADSAFAVCEGAYRELGLAGRLECSVEEYLAMARAKTAALTRAACMVGALLGGADPGQARALGAFGEGYGMAFQIRDDLLPYLGGASDEAMGKPADSDLRNQRPTLPLLLAYRHGDHQQQSQLHHALTRTPAALALVQRIMGETRALARAQDMADQHWAQACQALESLPVGPARAQLAAMPLPATAPLEEGGPLATGHTPPVRS